MGYILESDQRKAIRVGDDILESRKKTGPLRLKAQ